MRSTEPDDTWVVKALLASTLCWLALDALLRTIGYRRIGKSIGLPSKRRATFAPRRSGDFTHRGWIVAGMLAPIGLCAAYLYALIIDRIDVELFGLRLLLVGDFIAGNKFAYGIRPPILNRKVLEVGEPKVGDEMVFRHPDNPDPDLIKRVVGEQVTASPYTVTSARRRGTPS